MGDAICTSMWLLNIHQCTDILGCGSLHDLIFSNFSDFGISFEDFGILKFYTHRRPFIIDIFLPLVISS
jgi:hypothetical protein